MFLDTVSYKGVSQLSTTTDVGLIKKIVAQLLWDWFYSHRDQSVKIKWKFLNLSIRVDNLRPLIELLAGPDALLA